MSLFPHKTNGLGWLRSPTLPNVLEIERVKGGMSAIGADQRAEAVLVRVDEARCPGHLWRDVRLDTLAAALAAGRDSGRGRWTRWRMVHVAAPFFLILH
jgi:hypothetical protein